MLGLVLSKPGFDIFVECYELCDILVLFEAWKCARISTESKHFFVAEMGAPGVIKIWVVGYVGLIVDSN